MKTSTSNFALKGLAALLVVLVLGECFTRLVPPHEDMSPPALKAQEDRTNLLSIPSLFSWRLLARQKHDVYFTKEDSFRFDLPEDYAHKVKWHINSHGYRGPEFAWEKPAGTTRIVIYGGSFVFDIRTVEGMDWPRQAEKILRERGHQVEIINAGIPGLMSFDAVGRLFTEGHDLDPDYVVICNKWNDLKYFRSSEPLSWQMHPWAVQSDPRFEYQGALDRWLGGVSQLYCRLRYRHYESMRPPEFVDHVNRSDFKNRPTPEALRQYRLHFQMFADTARDLGVKPILMTQPLLIRRDNPPEAREIIEYEKVEFSHEQLCEATEQADSAVRSVAAEKHVPLIDGSASRVAGKIPFFTDQVHLNQTGSLEFAHVVADELEKIIP